MNVGVMWLLVLAVIGLSIVTGSAACIVLVIPSFFFLCSPGRTLLLDTSVHSVQ